MRKRLIKKASILQKPTCNGLLATSPMTLLSLLDDAEVKNNSCPICHTSYHLVRDKGFKICPYCDNTFKIWNGRSYLIHDNDINASINDMILKSIGMHRYRD